MRRAEIGGIMCVGNAMGGVDGFDDIRRAVGFLMVQEVAEALRKEFGVLIDAHPGGEGNEAGVVNRAFRAAAGAILGAVAPEEDNPAALLTWALRQAAHRRLSEVRVEEDQAVGLLASERDLGDRWLAYLVLAPSGVIEEIEGEFRQRPPRTPPW